MPMKPFKPTGSTVEQKLDEIVSHLERLDRRDRLRTYGGFVRTLIGFIPLLVFLASTWYVYKHGDELLKKITMEAAKQAAEFTESSADSFMQKFMPKK